MTGATAFKATAAFCKSDQGRPNGFFYTSLSDICYFARKISAARSAPGRKRAVIAMAEENIGQLERKANPQKKRRRAHVRESANACTGSRHSARVPLFILTRGDPAKRSDIFDIVVYAHEKGCASQATAASLAADLLIAWSVLSAPQAGDRLRAS
jgi:hypothetical protein